MGEHLWQAVSLALGAFRAAVDAWLFWVVGSASVGVVLVGIFSPKARARLLAMKEHPAILWVTGIVLVLSALYGWQYADTVLWKAEHDAATASADSLSRVRDTLARLRDSVATRDSPAHRQSGLMRRPRLAIRLDSLSESSTDVQLRYRVLVHNDGPGQAQGVRVRVVETDPPLGGELPNDLSINGTTTEASINATDEVPFTLFRWGYSQYGARVIDGFGVKGVEMIRDTDTLMVRLHVSAANADPLNRWVILAPFENYIRVTVKRANPK
jgi:hypothetical protein